MPLTESKNSASLAVSKNNKKKSETEKKKDVDIKELTQPSSKTKNRVNALKNNQLKYIQAQVKYYEELQKLQSKYDDIYGEIFERRKQIVSGEVEPTSDECKWQPDEEADKAEEAAKKDQQNTEQQKNDDDEDKENKPSESSEVSKEKKENEKRTEDKEDEEEDEDDEKGVPNFWLEVLQSSSRFEHLILEQDEPVLEYLVDIRVRMEREKPASSYTLEFEFADNPYFKNRVLTKTFEFKNEIDEWDPLSYGGPDLVRSIGCQIDWKPKKNVTVKLVKKKVKQPPRLVRGKVQKQPAKVITIEEKQQSFFRFFETHKCMMNEDDEKMKEEMKKIEEEKAAAKKENPTGDSESSQENKKEDEASDDAVSETSVEITNRLKDTFHMMFDYSLGERLRNKIIPKAVLYMTGDAQDSDREGPDNEDDDDEDDEDYYDEYDGEDYYDEDDDDDYDDHVRRQHIAVWNREMSERVFNNPIVRQGINPGNCAQS